MNRAPVARTDACLGKKSDLMVAQADVPVQQVEPLPRAVTSRDRHVGTPAAERKRRQRNRDRELIYETADWRLFTDLATLPQKAGCQPQHLCQIVLNELVCNGLDAGTTVKLDRFGDVWCVSDDGPGIDPQRVPLYFAVNRPLRSSKLRRLPLRGMLGNGLRVVAGAVIAADGSLVVETRGHRLTLALCPQTGKTNIAADEPVPERPGVTVLLSIGPANPKDGDLARASIAIAQHGKVYNGPSSPWWYGAKDLHKLFTQVDPADTTVGGICRSLGMTRTDSRPARSLDRNETAAVLAALRAESKPVQPEALGFIGRDFCPEWPAYARKTNTVITQAGAHIPYVAEAWVHCERPDQKGQGRLTIRTIINRSMTLAAVHGVSVPGALGIIGCGLEREIRGPGTGDYHVYLSVIAPYVQLATDGKEPSLTPFSEAIAHVLNKACRAAHRTMQRPSRSSSIKDAAWSVMDEAYRIASGDGRYPANARQIMYAARPAILRLTGKDRLDDAYFTQNLLPDYMVKHGKDIEWDVVFDSRGNLVEPHTGREVPLGTLEVRSYLGDHPAIGRQAHVALDSNYPTAGPLHRYENILVIEKEGFGPLLSAARIAQRFDVAIMATKGMSTTAARLLLDRLSPRIAQVLVLHDFDVSGFSIFGSLASDGRRYRYQNSVRIVDIGLRLSDVETMRLQSEPVQTSGDWKRRSRTLLEHGATWDEIAFLRGQRVELNAMPTDVFVAFLEHKLIKHGVRKIVPDIRTLHSHARRLIEQRRADEVLRQARREIAATAASTALPEDLQDRVRAALHRAPELSWDRAVAAVLFGAAS